MRYWTLNNYIKFFYNFKFIKILKHILLFPKYIKYTFKNNNIFLIIHLIIKFIRYSFFSFI